jgi:hypothetical protein
MGRQVIRLGRRTFGGPSLSYMWEYQSQMRSSVAPKSFLIELKQLYMENSKSFAKSDDGFPSTTRKVAMADEVEVAPWLLVHHGRRFLVPPWFMSKLFFLVFEAT